MASETEATTAIDAGCDDVREHSERIAAALASAGFVRIVTRPDGDALAASGLLARVLSERATPFQVTVGRTVRDRLERVPDSDGVDASDEVTIVIGASADDHSNVVALPALETPATILAVSVAEALGVGPDPVLSLAGVVAAGFEPGVGRTATLLERERDAGRIERRPGVGIPTMDPVDGLAHSTRFHASWSGDPEATRSALGGVLGDDGGVLGDDGGVLGDDGGVLGDDGGVLGDDGVADETAIDDETDHAGEPVETESSTGRVESDRISPIESPNTWRSIGSLVALDVVGAPDATDEAAREIENGLRPYATPAADTPFETVAGYADVLEAVAHAEPGTGVALAMGHAAREPAIEAWRRHGRRVHAALEAAEVRRYDGLSVVVVDDVSNSDGSAGAGGGDDGDVGSGSDTGTGRDGDSVSTDGAAGDAGAGADVDSGVDTDTEVDTDTDIDTTADADTDTDTETNTDTDGGASSTETTTTDTNRPEQPLESIANVALAYRSHEPVVLAVGAGAAGLATRESRSFESALESVTSELDRTGDAAYDVGIRRGYLTYDEAIDAETVVSEVRDAI